MRKLTAAIAILFAFSMLPSSGVNAQSRCKDGDATTITGTIASIEQLQSPQGGVIWLLEGKGKLNGKCLVEKVYGNGQAPSECAAGKKFTATGKALDFVKEWMLETDKLNCS